MSNKTMTLTDISKTSKEFKDTHTLQVGGFKDGGSQRITAAYVLTELKKSNELILQAINKINDRLDKIEQRFDNLVAKNNLKE